VHGTPQPGTPATFDGWGKVVARDAWPGALPTEMWAAVASASVALSAVGDGPASASAVYCACGTRGRRAGPLTNRTESCRAAKCNYSPDRITTSSPTARCKDPKSTHQLAHVAGVLMSVQETHSPAEAEERPICLLNPGTTLAIVYKHAEDGGMVPHSLG